MYRRSFRLILWMYLATAFVSGSVNGRCPPYVDEHASNVSTQCGASGKFLQPTKHLSEIVYDWLHH